MAFLADLAKGGAEGIFKGVRGIIEQFHESPEEKRKALNQLMDYETRLYELASSVDKAQIDLNKAEAQNPSLFVSGWRPFVGWTCAGGLAYDVIVRDLLNWVFGVMGLAFNAAIPLLPVIHSEILGTMLAALLGVAGLRTYEKLRGTARIA